MVQLVLSLGAVRINKSLDAKSASLGHKKHHSMQMAFKDSQENLYTSEFSKFVIIYSYYRVAISINLFILFYLP